MMNRTLSNMEPQVVSLKKKVCDKLNVEYGFVEGDLNSFESTINGLLKKCEEEKTIRSKNNSRYEEKVVCKCKSKNPEDFIVNSREGTMTCKNCGQVLASDILYEGDWTRNFEGEEDNSQCGSAFDPLMSSAYNLATNLITGTGKLATNKQRQQHRIEMAFDKIHQDDRSTRKSYKDSEKRKARSLIEAVVDGVELNEEVTDLAHRYFCLYRDAQEKVTHYNERIAECIILVYSIGYDNEKAIQELNSTHTDLHRKVMVTTTFECPSCHNSYNSKMNLKLHKCVAKMKPEPEKEQEKRKPVFRKKKLVDETDLLTRRTGVKQ